MALWANRKNLASLAAAGLLLVLLGSTGCGRADKADTASPDSTPARPAAAPAAPEGPTAGADTKAKGADTPPSARLHLVAVDPQQHQSFPDAVILEPPGDQVRPPDVTLAGKSVGKLYQMIAGPQGKGGLWDQVKFVSDAGKKLHYAATIHTDLGIIKMELFPEHAPNHVRNFVALARAGYYDGLQFDRAVREDVATEPGRFHEYLEAGCPLGTGEADAGSIGYWLRPEISDKVRHEAGTVGAVHGEDVESAACKFYITLNKAPWIDGQYTVFGKITEGLAVARTIFDRPKAESLPDRPQDPVTIRRVEIHVLEALAEAAK
jgi:cyclophilin family peptidyl-prolyl cis-trans isomerase